MEHPNFYEQQDFGGAQRPKRNGVGAGAIAVTALVCLVIGALVASVFLPQLRQSPASAPGSQQPQTPVNTPQLASPEKSSKPEATPKPEPVEPTPMPTQRPMADLDGQLPDIVDEFNPIPDIVDACAYGVVGIDYYSSFGEDGYEYDVGIGSGFIISSDGYIVTNAHVVEGNKDLGVMFSDGTQMKAEVIGYDINTDVAVLKVDKTGLKPLVLGDSSKLRVGEFSIAIGSPTGQALSGTTTFGIISALDRTLNIDGRSSTYIQMDVAINFGNSGGPLLNMKGEVVGITSAKKLYAGYDDYGNVVSAEGLSFAIPINEAKPIVEQLITKGFVSRPGIGVSVVQFAAEQTKEWGMPEGIVIYTVTKDGPAHAAGLKKYDVIVECNGKPIANQKDFIAQVQECEIGDKIDIKYWRDGEYYNCKVEIGNLNDMGSELVESEVNEKLGW